MTSRRQRANGAAGAARERLVPRGARVQQVPGGKGARALPGPEGSQRALAEGASEKQYGTV